MGGFEATGIVFRNAYSVGVCMHVYSSHYSNLCVLQLTTNLPVVATLCISDSTHAGDPDRCVQPTEGGKVIPLAFKLEPLACYLCPESLYSTY